MKELTGELECFLWGGGGGGGGGVYAKEMGLQKD